jgi:hypothetical protein
MINKNIVTAVDEWLDSNVSEVYVNQPLAQHWARISKVIEELGETISEIISFTGQNPRKPSNSDAYNKILEELADTAMTAIYAIQHFTKNSLTTAEILSYAQEKHFSRIVNSDGRLL